MSLANLLTQGWNPGNGYVPSYASRANGYLPSRNVYNFKPTNNIKTRASLARAAAGGLANWAFIGDSLFAGANGNGVQQDTQQAVPYMLQSSLVASYPGLTSGGTGVRPAVMVPGSATAGWTFTGGFSNNTTSYLLTSTGGTCTYVSPVAGTIVEIVYSDLSSNFSYTVDGGAANNVVPGGTNSWQKVTLPGQTNAVHTVVITSGANGFFHSVSVSQTTGLICHNLSMGGARLISGNGVQNWSDYSQVGFLANARLASLPAAIDTVFIQMGANDILNGSGATQTAAGYATIRGHIATPDLYLVPSWKNFNNTDAQWNAFLTAAYAQADALGATLLDWNDRVGGQATAQANGMLGPDNIHGNYATYAGFGKALTDLLLD